MKGNSNQTNDRWIVASVLLFTCCVLMILIQLGNIVVVQAESIRAGADSFDLQEVDVEPRRGNIYSESGALLATTITRYDVHWDSTFPKEDEDFKAAIGALSDSLADMMPSRNSGQWKSYLSQKRNAGKRHVSIALNIGHLDYLRLKTFPILERKPYSGGIKVNKTEKRIKPLGAMGSRLLGFDHPNRGSVGLEGGYSDVLKGVKGKRTMQKIAKGQLKPVSSENTLNPIDGKDLISTINVQIQDIAHHALSKQLEKFDAAYGCAVVMKVKSGEVVAMSNLTKNGHGNYVERFNYAVGESSEPGSTFKLMSVMAALEDGVADTTYIVDTRGGKYPVYDRIVRDSKHGGYGVISLKRAFELSSNTGIVQLIDKEYKNHHQDFVDRVFGMGLGNTLGIPIPGEGQPKIPSPKDRDWSGISLAWMAYGYGVSMTPLQILTFYNAVANEGKMVKPLFVKEIKNQGVPVKTFHPEVIKSRIASKQTISKAKSMLEGAVKYGTGQNIYSEDILLAGKTGTTQMAYWKKDEGRQYISSFAGYFPANDPEYSCIVVIYKPDTRKGYYGSTVAAPVFRSIAQEVYVSTPRVERVENLEERSAALDEEFITHRGDGGKTYSERQVPRVTGMSAMEAIAMLENMGMRVAFRGAGNVKRQSIRPGSSFRKGQKIVLDLG